MLVGLTVTLLPLPTLVPPQLPRYQRQMPPVPKLPPDRVKVADPPGQIVLVFALILLAAVEFVQVGPVTQIVKVVVDGAAPTPV